MTNMQLPPTLSRQVAAGRSRLNLEVRKAVVGDVDGTMGTMAMLAMNSYYIRYQTGNGYSTKSAARGPYLAGVKLSPGKAVLIAKDPSGQAYIFGTDYETELAGGGNPVPIPDPPSGPYMNQSQLTTLRVSQTPTPSLKVMVNDGVDFSTGVGRYFAGNSAVDLSGLVPGSGHCVVVVAIKSDFATTEAVASTSISLADPLTIDDVNNALGSLSTGSTPIWAFAVATGATTIADTDTFMDCRQLINIGTTGGGSAVYGKHASWFPIVAVGGPTMTYDHTSFTAQQFGFVYYQTSPANGDLWEYSCTIAAGTYNLKILGAHDVDQGKLDVNIGPTVAGLVNQGTIDRYGSSTANVIDTQSITVLADGFLIVQLKINGKNASSSNYYFDHTYIWIDPSSY